MYMYASSSLPELDKTQAVHRQSKMKCTVPLKTDLFACFTPAFSETGAAGSSLLSSSLCRREKSSVRVYEQLLQALLCQNVPKAQPICRWGEINSTVQLNSHRFYTRDICSYTRDICSYRHSSTVLLVQSYIQALLIPEGEVCTKSKTWPHNSQIVWQKTIPYLSVSNTLYAQCYRHNTQSRVS